MDTQTLYTKLSAVPPSIKNWVGSDDILNGIENIPHQFNLPDYASANVSKLIQRVLIKDVEPGYFAGELSIELNLDKNKAVLITEDIKKNIFTPIKDDLKKYGLDLSHFDDFNIPSIKMPMPASNEPAPKMVFDMVSGGTAQATLKPLNSVAPKPAPTSSTPVTTAVSQKPISAVLSSIPSATTKIPAASDGKFPTPSLTQAGWSKTAVSPTQSPQPTQATQAAPKPPAPSSSDPAPIILHEDAKFSSSDKTTDFHLARPGGGAEIALGGAKAQQVVKPAVLELGALPNAQTKPTTSAPKFTHYTQFQVSTQPIDRHVTEITAAAPKVTPVITPAPKPAPAPMPMPTMPTAKLVPTTPKPPMPPLPPKPIAAMPTAAAPLKPTVQPPQPPKPPTPPTAPQPQGKVVKVNYP